MRRAPRLAAAAACLFLALPSAAAPAETRIALRPDDGVGTKYVLERSDNICGLDNPRQLTRPVRVDYVLLLEATPEFRTMKKERIGSSTPRGIQLRTEAAKRVRRKCEEVRARLSYCSVWKKIERRDKKELPSITVQVLKKLAQSQTMRG